VDKLYWATNNVCLWKIKDEFDDEYISKIFGKEHQFLHLHYEFIRHNGKLYLEIHLEGSKSIDSTKYNQYKEFYKRIVDEKLNSTYIENETIDSAMKVFKEIHNKVETIKF